MRTITHATFTVERTYDATPQRVFAAFASLEAKLAWSACHTGQEITEFDFRPGGREVTRIAAGPGQPEMLIQFRYHDIVEPERIVFTYEMEMAGVRTSVSLVTVEIEPAGAGARLTFTEQGAWLDGHVDWKMVEEGTAEGLENLAAFLARMRADA